MVSFRQMSTQNPCRFLVATNLLLGNELVEEKGSRCLLRNCNLHCRTLSFSTVFPYYVLNYGVEDQLLERQELLR